MSRRRTHPGWLVALLAVLMLVPNGSMAASDVVVVPVRKASAVDLSPHVIWVLALGSDARRGQQVTRSRADAIQLVGINTRTGARSEEHTSELQSLMRNSYAVFCLKN